MDYDSHPYGKLWFVKIFSECIESRNAHYKLADSINRCLSPDSRQHAIIFSNFQFFHFGLECWETWVTEWTALFFFITLLSMGVFLCDQTLACGIPPPSNNMWGNSIFQFYVTIHIVPWGDLTHVIYILHWKKYFNIHFKSQNYSYLLDRNSCCKTNYGDDSTIRVVVWMEIVIKTKESRSQNYAGWFFSPVTLTVEINYIDNYPCQVERECCLVVHMVLQWLRLFPVNSVREVTKVTVWWTEMNWNELKLLNRYQFYQFIVVKTGRFSNILLLWCYWSYWMVASVTLW